MKRIVPAFLIIMIIFAALASCSPKYEEVESDKSVETQEVIDAENSSEEKTAEEESVPVQNERVSLGALSDKEYPSYADALKANEEIIRASSHDWQRDVNGNEFENNVLLYDLNGDDEPELILMTGTEGGGVLHILTMKDGKAIECKYDVVPTAPYVEDNEAAFKYINAGGGADYMIYSGKEKGVFYIAHNIWSMRMKSNSIKYIMDSDGQVEADTCVSNFVNNDPNDPPSDEYEIDGKAVSAKEGAAVFTDHRNDYKELLMYNMRYGSVELIEDFKVFQKLKTDKPLATGYDDVMKQLGEE